MRARSAAVLAAVALAAAGSPALAAPPACRLVTDPSGDGRMQNVVEGRPGVDIVSGDVASGRKNVVAVIRLASLEPDDMLKTGTAYLFEWEIDGIEQEMGLTRFSGGEQQAWFDPNDSNRTTLDRYPARVAIDTKKGTITFSVPRKINTELVRKGLRFENLSIQAEAAVNYTAPHVANFRSTTTLGLGGDVATSKKKYTDGAPSCVKGV